MTFLYSLEFLFCEIDVYFLWYCNWQKTLLNLNFVKEHDEDCYPQFAAAKYVSYLLIWLGGGGEEGGVFMHSCSAQLISIEIWAVAHSGAD